MSAPIECPHCEEIFEIEYEDFPERACDDGVTECLHCEKEFKFGWNAELEAR